MVTFTGPTCDRCKRRNVTTFSVNPPEAYNTVMLNRWRTICPSCFDEEAERGRITYTSKIWRRRVGQSGQGLGMWARGGGDERGCTRMCCGVMLRALCRSSSGLIRLNLEARFGFCFRNFPFQLVALFFRQMTVRA